jgi:hypothetical protein
MIRRIAANGEMTDAQLMTREKGAMMEHALRDDVPQISGWKWGQEAASAAIRPIEADKLCLWEDAHDQPRPVRCRSI